jgi:hypothetical protein
MEAESVVPLSEMGLNTNEAAALGAEVVPTWKGEPGLRYADAARIQSERRRRTEEHERLWGEHQRESRRWQEARTLAAVLAGNKARARLRGHPPGEAFAAAREAGTEAAIAYERTTPRPVFAPTGRTSVPLEYVNVEDLKPGPLVGMIQSAKRLTTRTVPEPPPIEETAR